LDFLQLIKPLNGSNFQLCLQRFCDVLLFLQICILGAVFARMSPDQKSRLVEDLQDLGLVFSHTLCYLLIAADMFPVFLA